MIHAIRDALVILPLGLILSGCAGPQHVESSSRSPTQRTTRYSDRSESRNDSVFASYQNETPKKADSQHDITLEQIRNHVQNQSAVLIDARLPDQFARGHIRGAINVPAGDAASYVPQVEQAAGRDDLLIIYCNGPSCGSSDMVCDYLRTQGFNNIRVYSPGWKALASAKNLQ